MALTACSGGGEQATATTRPTATPAPSPTPGQLVEVRLVRVSDGDTIVVEIDGLEYRVRYLGMDTPETHHPDIGAEWLGQEATDANKALLAGDTVLLEKDITDADHYDRILRYIWTPDGKMVQAYDWTSIVEGGAATLRAAPGADAEVVAELDGGTALQVTGIGWDETGGQWWYYVETNTADDGWVLPDALNWDDVTPG